MSTHYICFHGYKETYSVNTPVIDVELRITTLQRTKIKKKTFSTSRLLIDDQSILQNR